MPPDWSCSQDKQYFPGWKNEKIFCKEVPLSNDCLAAATPRAIAMSAVIKRRILVTLFLWCGWDQDRLIIAIPCSWQLPDFKLKKYFLATICFILASSLGKQSCWLCSWVSISAVSWPTHTKSAVNCTLMSRAWLRGSEEQSCLNKTKPDSPSTSRHTQPLPRGISALLPGYVRAIKHHLL